MVETPSSQGSNSERHEKKDIHVGRVVVFGVSSLLVLTLAGYLITLAMLKWMSAGDDAAADISPLLSIPAPPPTPKLQVSPTADVRELRASEEARLESYGWVDRDNGVVRIPIRRAIDLVVERGLPEFHGPQTVPK